MAREVEMKFLADGMSYEETVASLRELLIAGVDAFQAGSSIDTYWPAAHGTPGSFLRFRVSDKAELTVKVADKGNTQDRLEYNIPIQSSSKDNVLEAMTAVLGDPTAILWRYSDFQMSQHATISVIQNLEKRESTFIEVEGFDQAEVDHWVNKLRANVQFDLKQVKNSFYDIYVQRQGIRL